ncbi:hypothetical protein [Bacillus licheniformis]|uniref:hypothetical protein n=1 Tax=Bacillus licheniformis TaxID=1402 RepID=UPI000AC99763|nr:hypothetical protein [Bacillus licheniformis]
MTKPYSVRLKEVKEELFELESDRCNIGNERVIEFVNNEISKLKKEKLELEQMLQINF